MNIDLDSNERKILLDALKHPAYKEKIKEPKTAHIIRKVYRLLIEKLVDDEITSQKVKESFPDKKIIVPGKDN